MPRRRLAGSGGFVFHVMNRSAKQLTLFDGPDDYRLFLRVLTEAQDVCPIRLLEYCVMPNHWHLLVWPDRDDQLSRYMRWITGVHGQRWRRARDLVGRGAVYQGRFRWVAVQDGQHYGIARRYIRQNPVRAHLVERPEHWRWSSAYSYATDSCPRLASPPIDSHSASPVDDAPLESRVVDEIRAGLKGSRPFGDPNWGATLEAQSWLTAVLSAHQNAEKPSASQIIGKNEESGS